MSTSYVRALTRTISSPSPAVVAFFVAVLLLASGARESLAQVAPPDRRHLFTEDTKTDKASRSAKIGSFMKADNSTSQDLDVKAPQLQFLKEQNKVSAKGGVLISRGGIQAQSDEALVDTDTQDADLKGRMLLTMPEGTIQADQGKFNFESENGEFFGAHLYGEDGGYDAVAERISKISDLEYQLFDVNFTTCDCGSKDPPWSVRAAESRLTENGYAHIWDATILVSGVPVFYSPYLGFPIKEERESGLLFPSLGYSNQDGMLYKQPLFVVLDDSSDLLLTPFTETRTRTGSLAEYRQAFSRYNSMQARLIYSNESARGVPRDGSQLIDGKSPDSLRGTVTTGLADPTFDLNRLAIGYNQLWRSRPGEELPTTFLADVHYVSDDLLLREMDEQGLGDRTDIYTTSKILVRSEFTDWLSGEVSSEYNQDLIADDALSLQRLPEASIRAQKSFRPFGFNPYGAKLVTSLNNTFTSFDRSGSVNYNGTDQDPYDGQRLDIHPTVAMPFHIKNYLNGSLYTGMHNTSYHQDATFNPFAPVGEDPFLDSSNDRRVFNFGASIGTAIERVDEVAEDSWLARLTSLGAKNQDQRMRRIKNVIEPLVSYDFVPKTKQSDLPTYDSLDRIRNRSQVSYGFQSSWLGRFLPLREGADPIDELTPRAGELPLLDESGDIGAGALGLEDESPFSAVAIRRGEVREIANFSLLQRFDSAIEDQDQDDTTQDPKSLSDLSARLSLRPSKSFALQFDSDYDAQDGNFTSAGVTTGFYDDRGDALRLRYSYVDDNLNQVEGNAELVLTPQARIGYYTLYDQQAAEFIENRVGLRLGADCNCWLVDLSYFSEINPDRRGVMLSFTFNGLGDIKQALSRPTRSSSAQ